MPVLQDPKNLQRIICQPCSSHTLSCSSWCQAGGLLPKGVQGRCSLGLLKLFSHGRCSRWGWRCQLLVRQASLLPISALGNKQASFWSWGAWPSSACRNAAILSWTPSQSDDGNHPFPRTFLCFSEHQHRAIGETLCHGIALNIVWQIVFLVQVPYRHF